MPLPCHCEEATREMGVLLHVDEMEVVCHCPVSTGWVLLKVGGTEEVCHCTHQLLNALLQGDDLVLQALVQLLHMLHRASFLLQLLVQLPCHPLPSQRLHNDDLPNGFLVSSTLKPAAHILLDDD